MVVFLLAYFGLALEPYKLGFLKNDTHLWIGCGETAQSEVGIGAHS